MKKTLLCLLFVFALLLPLLASCSAGRASAGSEGAGFTSESVSDSIEKTEEIVEESSAETLDREALLKLTDAYREVIELFKKAVGFYASYDIEKIAEREFLGVDSVAEEYRELYSRIFASGYRLYWNDYVRIYKEDGIEYFGYAFSDLNKNGSPELILMTELYDVVAILSLQNGKPTLVFDNYDLNYNCRIDKNGRFYTDNYLRYDLLQNHVYSLNSLDELVLEREFLCTDAADGVYINECFIIINHKAERTTPSSWEAATKKISREKTDGHINKTEAGLVFIRLFGELNCVYNWPLSGSDPELAILSFSDGKLLFSIGTQSFEATLEGDYAFFDNETVTGRLELGRDSVWLTVEKCSTKLIKCGTYLYTRQIEKG